MERNENGYSEYNFSRGSAQRGDGFSGGSVTDARDGFGTEREGSGNTGGCRWNNGSGVAMNNMPEGSGSMTGGANARLAMAYAPMQCWRMLYSPDYGLTRGTIFEELDLPLEDCVDE